MKTSSAHLPASGFHPAWKSADKIAPRIVPARRREKSVPNIPITPSDRDDGILVFAALFILAVATIFLCAQPMLDFAASPDRRSANPTTDSTRVVEKK